MVYLPDTNKSMKRIIAWMIALAAVSSAFLNAADIRRSFPGRTPSPVFDAQGNLKVLYQNTQNGLSLAKIDSAGSLAGVDALLPAAGALGPVIKTGPSGETGIVWSQAGPESSEIFFGRIDGEVMQEWRSVVHSDSPLFSPDLEFDGEGNPWIACIRRVGPISEVLVADLGRKVFWVVNGRLTASALTPKLLAGKRRDIWVVWTGRDKEQDEIFVSHFQGRAWSLPQRINKNGRYPHFGPAVGMDSDGNPWVAWSAFDGRSYQIFCAAWNGVGWSEEERISDGDGADLSPAVAFDSGIYPLVVWSRSSGRSSALYAKYKQGSAWSPAYQIIPDQKEPIRSLRIAGRGSLFGLTWESDGRIESLAFAFHDLKAAAIRAAGTMTISPIINPSLDENQYTGFGDSITYAENVGYIPRLEPLLIAKYGSAKIWNEGFGGETTAEGLARMNTAIAAHLSRYLMLMEGTNDVIFDNISMLTAAFNLEEMVKKCLRTGVFPMIATIIPRNDSSWTSPFYRGRIYELNTRIRELAAAQKIPLVDQFSVFFNYPALDGGWTSLLLPDGVHPNPKGFELMARTWFADIVILPFSPVNLRVSRKSEPSSYLGIGGQPVLYLDQPGNMLRWESSPKWAAGRIAAFKLYRREIDGGSNAYVLVGSSAYLSDVPYHKFFDTGIVLAKRYAYAIAAERIDGVEGPCSEIVQDHL
jgi:lysophospholipase L1-like esterase